MEPLKNYTAADIARYHNGEMPDAEMHALEKAALDDPFLADALDGYVHTKTPAADVAFLKEQLHRRNGNVVPMYRWVFRVAAMLVLVAGFGWLAYHLATNPAQDIAKQQEAAPKQGQPIVPAVADTMHRETNALVAPERTVPEKERSTPLHTQGAPSSKPVMARTKKEKYRDEEATPGVATFSNPHAAPSMENKASASARLAPENTFMAKVVDEHNNAVPYAAVTDTQHQVITNTDAAGNFSMAAPDTDVTVSVNAEGYQQQQHTISPADSATRIVLQPARKKPATKGTRVQLEAAKPVGGWRRFNTYVDENLQPANVANNFSEDTEVVLSFDVDPSGNAINITVEKSLCPACDTTAVQLIQHGAKWQKTKQLGKARAHIRF